MMVNKERRSTMNFRQQIMQVVDEKVLDMASRFSYEMRKVIEDELTQIRYQLRERIGSLVKRRMEEEDNIRDQMHKIRKELTSFIHEKADKDRVRELDNRVCNLEEQMRWTYDKIYELQRQRKAEKDAFKKLNKSKMIQKPLQDHSMFGKSKDQNKINNS